MSKYQELIKKSSAVAIFTHINTDGDAIGSSLALRKLLINMGKKVDVFVDSTIPSHISFLPDIDKVNQKTCEKYDMAIALDAASADRLGRNKYKFLKLHPSIQIDHHKGNPNFADVNIVNTNVSSTSELLFNMIIQMNEAIDKDMATCLMTGIYTDTGNLIFSNTKPTTFYALSKLSVILNETIDYLTEPLNNSCSQGEFELKKYVYQNIEFCLDGSLAIIYLDSDIFQNTGTSIDDTKGLVYIPFQLKQVKITAIISRGNDGALYGSIRSKGTLNISKIAESFGGGGHVNAAGFKSLESFEKIKEQIIKETEKVYKC